jgi:hypothetical protein
VPQESKPGDDQEPPVYVPAPKSVVSRVNLTLPELANRTFPGISVDKALLLSAPSSTPGKCCRGCAAVKGSDNLQFVVNCLQLSPHDVKVIYRE